VSTERKMDEEGKKKNLAICDNTDEPREY